MNNDNMVLPNGLRMTRVFLYFCSITIVILQDEGNGTMTKNEAFIEINQIQDSYIDELMRLIENPNYVAMKTINFTSPTGTGKTKMMSKLINKYPNYYFIVTTLSKGQLNLQIRDSLKQDCQQDNFYVYGSADYKINSKLDAKGIIGRIPENTKCIWLRDEGHIKTNRFDALLQNVCYKVINFSATNMHSDIQCNFTQTMMLRTVNQSNGTPENAIEKLLEIKEIHKNVPGYNPCAIFRCVIGDTALYKQIVNLCEEHNLRYIDITENTFIMAELCKDDNEYDVIINKFKIVEGIDIRRAHVLYMDNQPANNATTIQAIGRCRRNALLYRNDIDILAPENKDLLKATRECYVYYNVQNMKINSDADGELYYAFCNKISCESLKTGMTVHVEDGQLYNGLYIMELKGCTGDFVIDTDTNTGFNVVTPLTSFYSESERKFNEYLFRCDSGRNNSLNECKYSKIHIDNVPRLFLHNNEYYQLSNYDRVYNTLFPNAVSGFVLDYFDKCAKKYNVLILKKYLDGVRIEDILQKPLPKISKKTMDNYIRKCKKKRGWKEHLLYNFLNFELYKIEDITSNSYLQKDITDMMNEQSQHYLIYQCMKYEESLDNFNPIFSEEKIWEIRELIRLLKAEKNTKVVNAIIYNVFLDNNNNNKYRHICCNKDDIYYYFRKHLKIKVCKKGRGINDIDEPVPVNDVAVKIEHVNNYFKEILHLRDTIVTLGISTDEIIETILERIMQTRENLEKSIIDEVYLSYAELFEPVTQDEINALKEGMLGTTHRISKSEFNRYVIYRHNRIVNDRESAIIGVDMMKSIKVANTMIWIEAKAITSKVGNYNKLNGFLSSRYSDELIQAKVQCFTGKNDFKLDKKCNAALGYCVEYYSKYVVYGDSYLEGYIDKALKEAKIDTVNSSIIVRACMLKYKDMMMRSFGKATSKIIKTVSVTALLQAKYEYFVNLVVTLGTQTAKYVLETLYSDRKALDNVDPDLSIRHICGLADYITTDTILDVKVRNNIDDKCVRQVLGYHYLSTKRSDLFIKKVIIYDAVSNKSVIIDITDKNLRKGYDYEER